VGKLQAVFHIEWDTTPGNTFQGFYYYPPRGRERTYRLDGKFTTDGGLVLREFTRKADGTEELSATCYLIKRSSGERAIFEGTMENTDGRKLPMSFSRTGLD
jgi:hypothetical protein